MARSRRPRLSANRWRELIDRQPRSGLSVAGFCAQAQVSAASFYQWRSRLRGDTAAAVPHASTSSAHPAAGGFVDLGVLGREIDGRFQVRLELGGGITLTLARG